MKKVIILIAGLLIFSSCYRNFDCICITTHTDTTTGDTSTTSDKRVVHARELYEADDNCNINETDSNMACDLAKKK